LNSVGEGSLRLRLDQGPRKDTLLGWNARPPCRDTVDIAPGSPDTARTEHAGDFLCLLTSHLDTRRSQPVSIRSGVHGNRFGNCELNRGATAEGCRHAPSDISRRRPLQTRRFGRRPLVNRSGQRNGCRRPTRWFRLRHRDHFGSLSEQRTKRHASQMALHDSRKAAGESGIRGRVGLVSESLRALWSP